MIKRSPLFVPIVSFLFGIIIAGLAGTVPRGGGMTFLFVTVLAGFIVILILTRHKGKLFYTVLCVFFLLLGVFRYTSAVLTQGGAGDVSAYADAEAPEIILYGAVAGYAELKSSGYSVYRDLPLEVYAVVKNGEEWGANGTASVKLFREDVTPEAGDIVAIGGKLSMPRGIRNPAGFDQAKYLSRQGISAVLHSKKHDYYLKTGVSNGLVPRVERFLFKLRDKARGILGRYLQGLPRAVTESAVLGIRSGMTDDAEEPFVRTGTMHILAVSGLHVGIVAFVIVGLLRLLKCPPRVTYYAAAAGICLFAAFAGGRASSIRAALMGSAILMGLASGRKTGIMNAVTLSAFFITFFWPGQLFQAGFILSYVAVLSIIYVEPVVSSWLGIRPRRGEEKSPTSDAVRFLKRSLSVSFAVWLGIMPAIALYFRIITPSMIFANLAAIPALFAIVALGFALVFTGMFAFLSPVSGTIATLLGFLVMFFMKTIGALSMIPFSHIRVPAPGWGMLAVYYAALSAVVILFKRNAAYKRLLPIFVVLAANLFVWHEVIMKPDGHFKVTFFDVNKGDAALIETAAGGTVLIDGGPGGQEAGYDAGREVIAPYLWQKGIRRIDCVILTHGHMDHMGGLLYVVRNFDIGTFLDGGNAKEKNADVALYRELTGLVKEKGISVRTVARGDIIEGPGDVRMYVLNPPEAGHYGDANNDSVVVRAVTGRENSVFFAADAGAEAMRDMLFFGPFLKSNVLKVPHHGGHAGDAGLAGAFIEKINCRDAVISRSASARKDNGLLKKIAIVSVFMHDTSRSGAVIVEEVRGGFKVHGFNEKL